MQRYVVQMRDRGVVTLPKEVRERYGLSVDTPLTLIDWDGVLVLSSRVPVVTEIARQLAAERAAAGVTVDDLLTAWAHERYGREVRPSTDDA
jgi:bifunctional DNA-binding transcriptional regulator/antitoxin component of YhaV-PrlF toxin-antitoxin module